MLSVKVKKKAPSGGDGALSWSLWIELESHSSNKLGLSGVFSSVDSVDIVAFAGVGLSVNVGVIGVYYTQITEELEGNCKPLHIEGSTYLENVLPLIGSVMEEVFPQLWFTFLVVTASCIQLGGKSTTVHCSATMLRTMAYHLVLGVESECTTVYNR